MSPLRSWLSRWWFVGIPLVLAGAAALVVDMTAANTEVFVAGPASSTVLLVGVIAALITAAVLLVRERLATAEERGSAEATAQQHELHRRFLHRLDHELKNPLTAIRAAVANLSALPPGAPADAARASVEHQSVRLSRLLADLRKLADLETRPLDLSEVDVGELLDEVADALTDLPQAQGRDLTVTVPRAPWPVPPVRGDRDLLLLAVHNLATNAAKFSGPEDRIELRANEAGSLVIIEVADTGSGIPEDEIDHVWDELVRGKDARSVPGSGLGLSLVRVIVARHGGHCELVSRRGAGTVVRVLLPSFGSPSPRPD